MKKIFMTMICLTVLGILSANAYKQQIAVQHNGNVTQCETLNAALAAAYAGDTIYLTAGTFGSSSTGFCTITKPVTIIGAGAGNSIIGGVIVAIPDTLTLTANLLEGVTLSNIFSVSCSINGLKCKKCDFSSSVLVGYSYDNGKFYGYGGSYNIKDIVFDRCKIKELKYISKIKNMTVANCNITENVDGSSTVGEGDVVFNNCNIVLYSGTRASFINCWMKLYKSSSTPSFHSTTVFMNCFGLSNFWACCTGTDMSNCYSYPVYDPLDESLENFIKQGWLGTDGTVVGMYGGPNPFTLKTSAPKVTDYSIGIDTEKKKLNVKITLGED